MKYPVNIIMLPTEDKSYIHIYENGNLFYTNLKVKSTIKQYGYQAHHLYITVSQDVEELKEGEKGWFYDFNYNKITQIARNIKSDNYHKRRHISKIIATTDPKLRTRMVGCTIETKPIPQLPQQFLKEFRANPNGKWGVEYEKIYTYCDDGKVCVCNNPKFCIDKRHGIKYKVNLNQDNTVNITSVKEKMISLKRAKKYARHQYYLGVQGKDLVEFEDWEYKLD